MRKVFKLVLTLCFTVLLSTAVSAQTQFGTISGRVLDPNGAAVSGAMVTVTNAGTGAKVETQSSDDGLFTLANVPAADYEISVTKQGFKTIKQKVTVQVSQSLTVDLKMQIGEIGETVNISAETAPINTSNAELSRTITGKELQNLPLLSRDPYALIGLSAGAVNTGQVTGDTRGEGLAVNGSRTSAVNFMLDGGENNDTFVAGVGQAVPFDAIQEFKVQTNSMTAEFGRNAIVANVITKSGSNKMHGSAYEFYRGAKLTSNSFEDNANGTPKSNFVRNLFGGSVGGRIIKDKTFFFGSVEALRVRSRGTVKFFVPTPEFFGAASDGTRNFINAFGGLPAINDPNVSITAQQIVVDIEGAPAYAGNELINSRTGAIIPDNTVLFRRTILNAPQDNGGGSPQNTYRWTGRIDHRFSDNTNLFGRYAYENSLQPAGTVSLSPYKGFDTGQRNRNQNLNLTLTHVFSPTLSSETRVIYNRVFTSQPLGKAPATTPCWQYDLNGNTATGDLITFPGYVPSVCAFAGIPFGGPQNIYQGFEGVTLVKGKHTIKAGGQYLHLRDNRTFGAFENGFFDTFSMQGMLDGLVDFIFQAVDPKGKVPGDVYNPAVDGPFGFPSFTRHFHYNEWAGYVEDSYKVNRKVTLNLGLRYEYFGVLHSTGSEKPLDANFYLNQVGVATGKTLPEQIRDGRFRRTTQFYRPDYKNFAPRVGFAYDIFGTGRTVLRAGFGIFYDRNFGNAVFNVIQNPPNYAVIAPDTGAGAPIFPNQFDTINSLGSTLTISSSSRMLNNDLRTAYNAQWNVTLEHDLFGKGIILSGSYVGANGYRLYSLNNLNQRGSCLLLPTSPCNPALGRTSRLNQTGVTGLNRRGNEGLSRYKALQFEVRTRRLANTGLQLNGTYTESRSRDNESSFFGDSPFEANFGFGFSNPFNPKRDLGPSTNDIRHRGTISGIWEIPFAKSTKGFARQALGGWTLNAIFAAQSGGAFTVYDGSTSQCQRSGTNFCFPIQVGAIPSITNTPVPGSPNRVVLYNLSGGVSQSQNAFCGGGTSAATIACTARLAVGLAGSEKLELRNQFRTPGAWNLDFSVLKNFNLPREGMALQLRGEFFNVFNHSNLYAIAGTNETTGGGQVRAARGCFPSSGACQGGKERRNIQLGVRLTW